MDTSIFTHQGKYIMLALDHRGSFTKLINAQNPDAVTTDQAAELKGRIIQSLASQFSGLLIDPVYGLPAFRRAPLAKGKPFLLPLEESGYSDEQGERYSKLRYRAARIKEWGASGAKLLVYFNAQGESASHQVEIAKQAFEDSSSQDLPLFLEIVTYGADREEQGVAQATMNAMNMLAQAGAQPAVWKLEFPGSEAWCQKVTEVAAGTPWILLTRGAEFDDFVKELHVAVANGAVGFLAGRAVWQEVISYSGPDQDKFLQETVPQRFKQISEIVLKR